MPEPPRRQPQTPPQDYEATRIESAEEIRRVLHQPPPPAAPADAGATRLESAEEVRQAILARQAELKQQAAQPAKQARAVQHPVVTTPLQRPQQRPPMALLCLTDDGQDEGEWLRLRAERTLIGRTEGDVRIPHDVRLAARHAEIVRQKHKDRYRWVLTDLGSPTGTWVRVGHALLEHQAELLLGLGHYRFEAPGGVPAGTRAWLAGGADKVPATLVEVLPGGTGTSYPLTLTEYWIGRDARTCAIARPDDPYLDPRHARLHQQDNGQWLVENNRSVNGLWLRVQQVPLTATCQFRLGEQRFLFRVV